MKEVHIVGEPGSGKPSLSFRLADILDMPVFEVDEMAGDGPALEFRMQQPYSQQLAEAARVASLPGRITEASFGWWTDELLRPLTSPFGSILLCIWHSVVFWPVRYSRESELIQLDAQVAVWHCVGILSQRI